MYAILRSGGLGRGGFNFDAKVRRQSIDPVDLLYGHIGGLDVCAHALMAAARLIEDGKFDAFLSARYAGWTDPKAQAMLAPDATLDGVAARVGAEGLDPKPRSGRQEWVENSINRYV